MSYKYTTFQRQVSLSVLLILGYFGLFQIAYLFRLDFIRYVSIVTFDVPLTILRHFYPQFFSSYNDEATVLPQLAACVAFLCVIGFIAGYLYERFKK